MAATAVTNLLTLLPVAFWNNASYLSSLFTLPAIGSPIEFKGQYGFRLQEYRTPAMPEGLMRQFLHFSYPEDMPDRGLEICYDRPYWPFSSTFLVFDEDDRIIGCAQFIAKQGENRLPVEYGLVAEGCRGAGGFFRVENDIGRSRAAEIYRLRRSFDVDPAKAPLLATMLFKALWAKIVQTKTEYAYITCDGDSREIRNLYLRRLFFQDPGVRVSFGSSPRQWFLLRKDCLLHEERFAALSRKHFEIQTFFRSNLKRKRLRAAGL